jgi:hypothetical protein
MTQRSAEGRTPPASGNALGSATPMEVVDLLLWALVELAGAVTIVPAAERTTHIIRYERGGTSSVLATVASSFGDALAARLAIVAGLPVGLPGTQLGRLRVRPGTAAADARVTELLVAVRTTPAGLEAEAHRMASGGPLQKDEEASPESLAAGHGRVGMYRVTGTLGYGGMGVVYLAEHVALAKPVALKVLHAQAAHDPKLAAQFLVEARAACRARHPGIVDVTDFGALSDGRTYLVMELVRWPTLAHVIDTSKGPLRLARAVTILRNVAEALAAAAAHGVVHRDLTPTNIFVGDDDATKIGDFGLARIADHDLPGRPTSGGFGGTAGYMSPEQWLGEPSDTRSDIYSLGVILFRMVTGRMPFHGSDPLEILHQQQSEGVPAAIGVDGPVPEALQRLIERAMASRASERYQTVDELLLALREFERAVLRSGWTRWLE